MRAFSTSPPDPSPLARLLHTYPFARRPARPTGYTVSDFPPRPGRWGALPLPPARRLSRRTRAKEGALRCESNTHRCHPCDPTPTPNKVMSQNYKSFASISHHFAAISRPFRKILQPFRSYFAAISQPFRKVSQPFRGHFARFRGLRTIYFTPFRSVSQAFRSRFADFAYMILRQYPARA